MLAGVPLFEKKICKENSKNISLSQFNFLGKIYQEKFHHKVRLKEGLWSDSPTFLKGLESMV